MALPAIEVVHLFRPERAALLELLRSLDQAEWWLPTVCGDWTVHDVAIHLIGADVNGLSGDRDDFRGAPGTGTKTDLSHWSNLVEFIDQRNDEWVAANRRMSPRLVCEMLEFTGRKLDAVWPTLDPNAVGHPVSWAGRDPAPVWLHIAREYTECWTHQQHIRDAVGRPGFTERQWMHPVLDAFTRALPVALSGIAAPRGSGVGLRILGTSGGKWWAEATPAGWELVATQPESVLAEVQVDQDTAWRFMTRGIDPAEARQVAVTSGDARATEAVMNMVSMIVG